MLSTWKISVTLSDNGQINGMVLCVMFCRSLFVPLYFFPLAIVLSVHLLFTDSDFPFGIFELFSIH